MEELIMDLLLKSGGREKLYLDIEDREVLDIEELMPESLDIKKWYVYAS